METGTETPTVNWKMGEGGTSLMGGARNNFKGGEEIGGEEWWSYRCEVFLFFSRGEVSFGKSAFAIGGTFLSLFLF